MSRLKAFSISYLQTFRNAAAITENIVAAGKGFSLFVSLSFVVVGSKRKIQGWERAKRENTDAKAAKVTVREPPRECTVFIYDRRKIQAFFDHVGGRFPLIK